MALPRKLTAKIYEIKAHNANVNCLDLGETGRVLVTGGQDRNVNLWAIGQQECFMSLTGHNRPIDCVRFAYNDDFVYSADDIGIIRRWDLNAQTICSTLNGHMKSVRTLDFNPSGEYVVSGSNDTTVRLWDVRNQNKCIKVYRGHISYVNSVKFSPDGLWIASAGTEGSVIIWDIRKSKQIMEFIDQPPMAAITCIQFHPFEFLLAVGRIDGTVCIYDLERLVCISRTDATSQFYGNAIKCVTFSDNGECLFVGTAAGLSVIGWEPDREFDHIKSTWTALGDMKVVNKKLFCGCYENDYVAINALSIDRVIPFYNPSNNPPAFNPHSTQRKSFSRGTQKLRLSITGTKPTRLIEENEDNKSSSLEGQSSPNLSLELVDETTNVVLHSPPPLQTPNKFNGYANKSENVMNSNVHTFENVYPTTPYTFSNYSSTIGFNSLGDNALNGTGFEGPCSLQIAGERDLYQFDRLAHPYDDDDEHEYNPNDSNPPIISNYEHTEMVEDFPVNQNLQPNGVSSHTYSSSASSSVSHATAKTTKPKTNSHVQKRSTQISIASGRSTSSGLQQRGKLSQVSSVSSTDLHKLDDNMVLKKSMSSNFVANRGKRPIHDAQSQLNKENARNKNITVQFITKPPTRSRTSLELRTSPQNQQTSAAQRQSYRISSQNMDSNNTSNIPVSYRVDQTLLAQSQNINQRSFNGRNMMDDSSEIQMLSVSHEQVYQELSNRHATLQLIRNSTRSHDIVHALKQAIKLSGRSVFVDLLGAILEKTSSWNLDLCLLLLPEIYELLQSHHKFHYTRACDTLRVILSNFLPIIQENIDPWAASGLGVDVTREERQRKCLECQRWLLQIRNIPDSNHCGTTLTQLQNMITI